MPGPAVVAGRARAAGSGLRAGAGAAARQAPNAAKAGQAVENAIPQLEDEVTVEVVGQPGASKKTLYYLALATANGMIRQYRSAAAGVFVTPPAGAIMIEYDAADMWVRCTIRYKSSGAPATVVAPGDTGAIGRTQIDQLAVYAGPQCGVVGLPFNFTGTVGGAGIPLIPRSSTSFPAPKLPFAKRQILTVCPITTNPAPGNGEDDPAPGALPSGNPRPPGDLRSRGAVVQFGVPPTGVPGFDDDCCARSYALVPLVFASLSDPGSYGGELFKYPE